MQSGCCSKYFRDEPAMKFSMPFLSAESIYCSEGACMFLKPDAKQIVSSLYMIKGKGKQIELLSADVHEYDAGSDTLPL